jgi:hypothetical protein
MAKRYIQSLKSSLKDVVGHAVDTGTFIAKNADQRMAICLKCTQYDPKGWCKQCGCYLAVKTKLAGSKCPLGLW